MLTVLKTVGKSENTSINQGCIKTTTCASVMDQQKQFKCPTEGYQSTEGVQWLGLDNVPGEEPTHVMVSETNVYGLEPPVSLVYDNANNVSKRDQPLVRQAASNTVNRSPTTV